MIVFTAHGFLHLARLILVFVAVSLGGVDLKKQVDFVRMGSKILLHFIHGIVPAIVVAPGVLQAPTQNVAMMLK